MSQLPDRGKVKDNLLIFSWGLYDMANQFFVLNIVSLYFVRWITIEKQAPEMLYSIAFGVSVFLVAAMAPFLGTVSDLIHRHRLFLVWFTLLSVIFTVSLGMTESIFWGLLFFAIANFGCQAAVIFYNALLINIAPKGKIGLVSGIGRMLGYCGAGLGIFIVRPLVLQGGYRAAFIPTGLLFFIFSLPCMLFVKDKNPSREVRIFSLLKEKGPIFPLVFQNKVVGAISISGKK
ncbi:MFS transporter, partial [Candidatus Omnitrophota bacterium]